VFSNTDNIVSIQRDTGLEQLAQYPDIARLDDQLKTLQDLFSCISNLELVITSCTSIAHIASSMGKDVCVIVPISCYYIWCNPNKECPWYGSTTKVFYQQHPRSWSEPLQELKLWLDEHYKDV
jgi:ADP-heptose:LPS heptosyltransferase